jgi:N6-adenosine-specific RNA methylase IME4
MAKVMGGKPDEPVGVKEAAKRTGTSPSTVDRSDRVRREGSEALFQALLDGKIETTVAVAALQFTHDEQDQIAESEAPATKVKVLKRRKRELELAEATDKASEALGLKQYSVIYADPAWKFEVRSEKGESRSASNHYPTMDLQDILALNVAEAAHDDCVLFLWATAPMLLQAFLAMSEWGFEYKSHMIWDKEIMGNGYWFRNQHELLLVGTKGDIPAPAMGSQSVSVLRAPRGSHSEKPDACYDMIEGLYPNAPKLEMFARGEGVVRDGWTYWGNEAPSDD